MREYFFIGDIRNNTGPSNVNKGITANLTDKFNYIHAGNKVTKMLEAIYKTLTCKVIIVSGISRCGVYMLKTAKLLNKKSIYIMHGCGELEAILNQTPISTKVMYYEKEMLKMVDLILPVSHKFSLQMQKRYPQYKEKFHFLYNGLPKVNVSNDNIQRIKGTVIAVGGDRKLKNNITVAKAMDKVRGDGKLSVFGYLYNPDNLPKHDNIEFKGLVSQEQLYKEMMASELYVLNSVQESFALSVFDALFCGCSILISSNVGAVEILDITDQDVINDPMNEDEIAEKISYLLEHPNNERIMKNLDFDRLSYESEVKKLEEYCAGLVD